MLELSGQRSDLARLAESFGDEERRDEVIGRERGLGDETTEGPNPYAEAWPDWEFRRPRVDAECRIVCRSRPIGGWPLTHQQPFEHTVCMLIAYTRYVFLAVSPDRRGCSAGRVRRDRDDRR